MVLNYAMYGNTVTALNGSSKTFCKHKNKVYNIKPGWKDFVAEQHALARDAFKLWAESGRPRQGSLFEHKKKQNKKNLPMQDLNMLFVLLRDKRIYES